MSKLEPPEEYRGLAAAFQDDEVRELERQYDSAMNHYCYLRRKRLPLIERIAVPASCFLLGLLTGLALAVKL